MNIKLDDVHYLVSDPKCLWIETEVTPKDGKKKPYKRRSSGYAATFEGAVESYIKEAINSSEATKISKLAKEIKALKEEVRGWHETYNRELNG